MNMVLFYEFGTLKIKERKAVPEPMRMVQKDKVEKLYNRREYTKEKTV